MNNFPITDYYYNRTNMTTIGYYSWDEDPMICDIEGYWIVHEDVVSKTSQLSHFRIFYTTTIKDQSNKTIGRHGKSISGEILGCLVDFCYK